ncbi:acetyl-CoA acetyltransferase [Humitalea rosea]|uniref:Acetyl-CoA acetyltransferase n=1 Tax=Humitalea rosea TaxID=990373 RepID=A0A2W7HXK8_9PROT|nr:thiolase family protein [Humitalea rosea]PZW39306.1 acetyl-CoA acetyltransferase [Humitalea rosea]
MSAMGSATAIVGMGRAMAMKGEGDPKTPLQLGAVAARQAMAAAGIGRHEVGALFTGRTPQSYMVLQYNQSLLNELKIGPTFSSEMTSHGGGALGTLQLAATALQAGVIDYALCVTNEASGIWMDQVGSNAAWEGDLQFEAPYGPSTPSIYAQSICRYMHEYGITPEMAAHVAVENRRWALDHPHAVMRHKGPITIEQVVTSRLVATPLRLLDCAVWYPGGIATAVVLTRADLARARHGETTWLAGFGQCNTHEWVGERMGGWGYAPFEDGPDLVQTGAGVAAKQAYAMAGLTPADIDLAESSAPFSYVNLMMLEELGFCPRGEGGNFAAGGGIAYDGGLPFNTIGGYLSFGQVAQGLYNLQEVVDQLHGRAEGRQIPDAKAGIVHMHGGPLACHSVVILSKEPVA